MRDLKVGTAVLFRRGCCLYEGRIVSVGDNNGIRVYEVDVSAPAGGPPTGEIVGIHDQQIVRAFKNLKSDNIGLAECLERWMSDDSRDDEKVGPELDRIIRDNPLDI